jgi:hypothetical protein
MKEQSLANLRKLAPRIRDSYDYAITMPVGAERVLEFFADIYSKRDLDITSLDENVKEFIIRQANNWPDVLSDKKVKAVIDDCSMGYFR